MWNEGRPATGEEGVANEARAREAEGAGRGNLFVVSAPSGAGKSSLVERALRRVRRLRYSISYTTREARGAERHAQDYFFVSEEIFRQMRERGEFLE